MTEVGVIQMSMWPFESRYLDTSVIINNSIEITSWMTSSECTLQQAMEELQQMSKQKKHSCTHRTAGKSEVTDSHGQPQGHGRRRQRKIVIDECLFGSSARGTAEVDDHRPLPESDPEYGGDDSECIDMGNYEITAAHVKDCATRPRRLRYGCSIWKEGRTFGISDLSIAGDFVPFG
jgi:hypothetical protein